MSTEEKERFVILIVAVATYGAMLFLTAYVGLHLRHIEQRIDQIQVTPRPTPTVASRSLVRPFLTVPPPSDHAAAGRDQTSAEIQTEANTAKETADEAEGLGAGIGEGAASGPTAAQWAKLRWCESRGEYAINTGNGYYGAYQFDLRTWHGIGMTGRPDLASPDVQDAAALKLYLLRGWQPWPVCGRWLR